MSSKIIHMKRATQGELADVAATLHKGILVSAEL